MSILTCLSYIRAWGIRVLINTAELRCQNMFPWGFKSKKENNLSSIYHMLKISSIIKHFLFATNYYCPEF